MKTKSEGSQKRIIRERERKEGRARETEKVREIYMENE